MLWYDCRDGYTGKAAWPDGGSFLDQPVRLTRAFSIFAAENDFWNERLKNQ